MQERTALVGFARAGYLEPLKGLCLALGIGHWVLGICLALKHHYRVCSFVLAKLFMSKKRFPEIGAPPRILGVPLAPLSLLSILPDI